MEINIESFITKSVDINWNLNNHQCPMHQANKKPCTIYVDKNKYTKNIIHHINYNYMVKNYETYCVKRYSSRNKLLNYCTKLTTTSNKCYDYITVDNHNVYKINYAYVTFPLLLYINELSLNTDVKMWGMY